MLVPGACLSHHGSVRENIYIYTTEKLKPASKEERPRGWTEAPAVSAIPAEVPNMGEAILVSLAPAKLADLKNQNS